MSVELCDHTASDLSALLRRRQISAVELLDAVIARIEAVEGRSGRVGYQPTDAEAAEDETRVHAYIAPLTLDTARRQARAVDEALARGSDPGPLAGIPLAVKDIFCVKDTLTTAASFILHNYTAPYDATPVERLREQGAVVIGKTNLDEFVFGSSTESSAYKPVTRNPWDTARVPGGSSGGSAAAVAAGEAVIALGTDTAGSVRQPAASSRRTAASAAGD